MTDTLLSVLYPQRCPACRDVIENDGSLIHDECRKLFRIIAAPRCFKCGRHIEDSETALCPECSKKNHSYDYGFAALEYNSTAKKAMTDFKFNGWRQNSDYFAETAARAIGNELKAYSPEVLVPVPVTGRRLHERGFNQAELLAKKLGLLLNIPVDAGLLVKEANKNVQQKKLSARERNVNARLAFECAGSGGYHRVCIVDDIYTTGSTVDSCAVALKKAGIAEVGFVAICAGNIY